MKVEGYLFTGCAAFFAGVDVVYWHFSKDPTGSTALALAVGLAFLTGFYVRHQRRHRRTRLLQPAQLVAAVHRAGLRRRRDRRGHRMVAFPDWHAFRCSRVDRLCFRVLPGCLLALARGPSADYKIWGEQAFANATETMKRVN